MKVALIGKDGALKRQIESELAQRGVASGGPAPDCVICLSPERVREALAIPGLRRLVLRSHAYAYGSNTKNPGYMTEERVSLLPPKAAEQHWLQAEEIALAFGNSAVIRLTNLLDARRGRPYRPADIEARVRYSLIRARSECAVHQRAGRRAGLGCRFAEFSATGIFNAAGGRRRDSDEQAISARPGPLRIPAPGWRQAAGDAVQLDRLLREGGARAGLHSRAIDVNRPGRLSARTSRARGWNLLAKPYDDYGLDMRTTSAAWGWWFAFLRKVYWRNRSRRDGAHSGRTAQPCSYPTIAASCRSTP